jgi:outer membrane protein TolC
MPKTIQALRRMPITRSALRLCTLALMLLPLGTWAQPVAVPPLQAGAAPALQDWRGANDAVAQFKRGHIDLLKWESSYLPDAPPAAQSQPNLTLSTAADAVRKAWRVHPDLSRTQSRLGAENSQRIAQGRWDAVDASLQRRVEGMDELLEVAAEARKTWLEAVAAHKVLRFREAALISAEAGNELGRRMVSVGNWSPLQSTPFRLATANARMALSQARLASAQADGALLQLLRLSGTDTRLGLPIDLPEVPATAMTRDTWVHHLAAVQAHVPGMDAVRNRVASETAFAVYQAAHGMARSSRDEVLAVRRFITEETVLHYNGMLKSVWDLLDEVSNQAVAEVDAIAAQRDFWLAEADLNWTLQGGAPTSFVPLGIGSAEAAKPAGH